MIPYLIHREAIRQAVDERYWPIEWIDTQVSEGRIAVMGDDRAVIGVERREYPGGMVELHGMFAAGDRREIRRLVQNVCEAARIRGCHVAAIESREGWEREFRGLGFRREKVRIVKDLANGS